MSLLDDFGQLKIQLKDIKLATNDFRNEPIGKGGFGKVYKGDLLLLEGSKMVAFKRLDRRYGQGDVEFWKEIMMLSQHKHENLISLLHFCNEEGERILVYEYAPRGSLDRYLGDTSLTWIQRLKICHGVASGLQYLHNPTEMHQRVLHRDVKSANILLDENLTAKITDFGLSKFGPANQKYTCLLSNLVGTPGYCDPMCLETGSLSKESDVYSFGVVLFEVMCGRQCFKYYNNKCEILVPMWKQCYEENRLDDIVCKDLKEQIDGDSLKSFSSIAYRCLHRDRKQRPTFAEIIKELEIALDHQETSEDADERSKFEERISIANQATTLVSWKTRNDLTLVLSKGILLNGGDHWLSLFKNGEYCEMICGEMCIPSDIHVERMDVLHRRTRFSRDKRFPYISLDSNFQLQASPRYLSPNVTYSINLAYRERYDIRSEKWRHVPLKYKLHTETEYQTSCVAKRRGDWITTELYQFTSYQKEHHFRFDFLKQLTPIGGPYYCKPEIPDDEWSKVHLIGIEFRPLKHEKDKKSKEDKESEEEVNEVDMKPFLDMDDNADITECLKCDLQQTSNEELYDLLRKGFLMNKFGEKWFSLSKSMKKCYMLPATEVLKEPKWKSLLGRKTWKYVPGSSRFKLVAESCKMRSFTIDCQIYYRLHSPKTKYGCYLVYELPEKHNPKFSGLVQIDCKFRMQPNDYEYYFPEHFVDLTAPAHIPFIGEKIKRHSKRKKTPGHPKRRDDGWMEIQIWDFLSRKDMLMHCRVKSCTEWNFEGLRVQGIEFRPPKRWFVSETVFLGYSKRF